MQNSKGKFLLFLAFIFEDATDGVSFENPTVYAKSRHTAVVVAARVCLPWTRKWSRPPPHRVTGAGVHHIDLAGVAHLHVRAVVQHT